jgi:hypothetical protein
MRITVLKMVQRLATDQNSKQTRFLPLLVSLLGLMVLEPFLFDRTGILFLLDIFFSLILFTCVYAVSEKPLDAVIAIVLGIPKLATLWWLNFSTQTLLLLADSIFGVLFMAYIVVLILRYIFKEEDVTVETIYGAIVVYILIGLLWVFLYKFTEFFHPGSFSFSKALADDKRKALYYYSFVTLTTLGYGDISPVSGPARSLAIMEAIMGQMYIAVLIARLVGMHISQGILRK